MDDRETPRTDTFWSRNALSLACFAIFAVVLNAQSLTGWQTSVADAVQHGEPRLQLLDLPDDGALR